MNADLRLRRYFIAARRYAKGEAGAASGAACSNDSETCSCRIDVAGTPAHPTADQWARLAEGMMGGAERRELHRHARECVACGEIIYALGARTTDDPRRLPRRVTMLIPMAAAAAFVLMLWYAPTGVDRDLAWLRAPAGLISADASLAAIGYPLNESSRELASLEIDQTEHQRFREGLQSALNERPNQPELRALATRAALTCRDWPAVRSLAERWTEAVPGEAAAWNVRGLADFAAGDYALAQQSFERALAIRPRESNYLLNAAQAADRAGNLEQARKWLLRYLNLADADKPDTAKNCEVARRWLEELGP